MTDDLLAKIQDQVYRNLVDQESICKNTYGSNVTQDNRPPIFNQTSQSWMCPAYWDTIYCWPETPANTTAIVECPSYVTGFNETHNASRTCNEGGFWFLRNNKTWSNYTGCYSGSTTTILVDVKPESISKTLQNILPVVKMISQTGYAASLISLIIAFLIMFSIKKLHCARNILHMNLFASFILRAFILILKDLLFYEGLGTSEDFIVIEENKYFNINMETNNFKCKLLTSFVQYFTTANYSWILMEGLYLNNLIFRALFVDSSKNIVHYIILGWGLPLLVVIPWILARIWLEDTLCWTSQVNNIAFLIIAVPTIISIIINFILFVIISIVLYSKLRSPINEDSRRYQKWAKSTLVLVPLFGVHYFILLIFYFVRKTEDTVELIWLICDILFGSFQGFFVAILYCFLNGDVKVELKPYINSVLTYLAANRCLSYCFPCRERYLRSAMGRTSVCTTMSCSSLYTNGVIHHRNSRSRLGDFPKNVKNHLSQGSEKYKDHVCANRLKNMRESQTSLNIQHKQHSIVGSNGMAETALTNELRREKCLPEQLVIEEEICMLENNFN
ncbi:vasoactive intestinal polypeptide receptor 1-like [Aethina tumida]|uniref:vasoactive intestinal polypeptide receptor 1-like n=1 Tax=Aethina tumida TaxID=116153 RepID=UPI00096B35C9|nr:vasoactive intestinal polypeptide receptor 1-like [Aethina tumida]